MRTLILTLALLLGTNALAHAQDAGGEGESVASASPAPAARERRASDPSEDELAEVSSGPSLVAREAAARRGQRIDLPGPDTTDADLPVALRLFLGGGSTLAATSLDLALRSHDFGAPQGLYMGDISILGRALEWLWIGGRLGGRGRVFPRNDGTGGDAGGVDLLALVELRFQLGRVFELGAHVGGGGGVAALRIRHDVAVSVVPRVTAGIHLAFRVSRGFRLFLRGAYDYFPWFDMDRYGDDLDLGGLSGAIGLEVRS